MMRVLVLMMAVALAGCAVGPDFKVPGFDVGKTWFRGSVENESTAPLPPEWWKELHDPVLDQLVHRALSEGTTLRMAEARVKQARAQRRLANAAFWPEIGAGANAQYAERSENVGGTGGARQGNLFTAGFDAAWELDIFGGTRRAAEAARADLAAARADAADVRLSLAADVVATYTDYRLAQERVRLAEANVAAQSRTVSLTEARYAAGDINGLDMEQARTQLAATRAQLPLARQQLELARGVLAVLVDDLPTTFTVSDSVSILSTSLPPVPAGLPSTLLERRPDIIVAQKQLHAATARVGEAQALRFPIFSLTAALGTQSTQLTNLLANGSGFWSLTPAGSLALLDGGARRAQVAMRKAQVEEAEAAYRQVVLNALRDVESSLTNLGEERARMDDLEKGAFSSVRAYRLADTLYREGEQNLLPVLEAQGAMLNVQDQFAQSRAQAIKNWVALVKALGGGYAQAD